MAGTKKLKPETQLWIKQAEEHWKDVKWLIDGRRYSASLYSCHQTLEKIIKAAIVENKNKVPSKGHQLESLIRESGIELPEKTWNEDLAEITRHFWRVRYPDFRQAVYTSKTKVLPTFEKTREIYLWLIKNLKKS